MLPEGSVCSGDGYTVDARFSSRAVVTALNVVVHS